MSKLIYGVGYNSKDKYKSFDNGKRTSAYSTWRNILERCYSPKIHETRPTYIGCTMHESWHNFQVFADWFYGHGYSDIGYHLDKDLLIPKNKVYSPDTCCFVPIELNSLLTDRRNDRGDYPQGVSWHKRDNIYHAQIMINGNKKHLGYFKCLEKACQAYKITKEAYVKEKALEWQGRIADNVFIALINWQL